MTMKKVEAQGYSKEKAFVETGLEVEFDMLTNATISWKKAGSPLSGAKLESFMAEYLKSKKAVGAYIVVDPSSDNTRTRPYSIINEVTKGARKATTVYQIKPAELKVKTSTDEEGKEVKKVEVLSTGAVAGKAKKQSEAEKIAKELIAENSQNYVAEIVKEVTEGQRYAFYGLYTPSKSAKQGKFIFFTK